MQKTEKEIEDNKKFLEILKKENPDIFEKVGWDKSDDEFFIKTL